LKLGTGYWATGNFLQIPSISYLPGAAARMPALCASLEIAPDFCSNALFTGLFGRFRRKAERTLSGRAYGEGAYVLETSIVESCARQHRARWVMIDATNASKSTPASTGFRVTPQLLFGLLVIAAGLLFTLDNLGYAHAEDYLRFWPAGLIGIGGLKLWQARQGSGSAAGFLFIIAGSWLLLEELAVLRIQFRDLWPLLLVFFGSYLVWQGLSARLSSTVGDDGSPTLSAMAILGAVSRGSNSQVFRGADLTAIMGGCELDLRNAAINGDAVIDVFALWGGIEIRVPEEWAIESRIVPVLGGVEEKTRGPQPPIGHRVTLRGFAIMSGVDIKN
jgi:hypothetical protein